jgi:uncharacterized membrane protein
VGARAKLNAFYVYAAFLLAALIGASARSWAVFAVTLAVALAGSLVAGDIRPRGRRW